MKTKISKAAQILLGLIYFVFGLNGLFNFLPMTPPPMPEGAISFSTALMASGYFFPVLKTTEALFGLLLLVNFAAPAALVILAPVTLHIFLFHFFLTPGMQNIALPAGMVVMHILAATAYWSIYRPLFFKK